MGAAIAARWTALFEALLGLYVGGAGFLLGLQGSTEPHLVVELLGGGLVVSSVAVFGAAWMPAVRPWKRWTMLIGALAIGTLLILYSITIGTAVYLMLIAAALTLTLLTVLAQVWLSTSIRGAGSGRP